MFGPVSPSPIRLKSWAAASGTTRCPSQRAKTEISSPASSSSITIGPSKAAAARRPSSSCSAVSQMKTPLPAARPSTFTTHGGRATEKRLGRRNAGRGHHVLGEALRPLDPRRLPTRAEDADTVSAQRVADAGDERRLGADHGQVGVDAAGEPEQGFGVVRPDGVAVADRRDPWISRRGVKPGQARCLRQLPRKRVLATARPDEEHLHRGRVYSPSRPSIRRRSGPRRPGQ